MHYSSHSLTLSRLCGMGRLLLEWQLKTRVRGHVKGSCQERSAGPTCPAEHAAHRLRNKSLMTSASDEVSEIGLSESSKAPSGDIKVMRADDNSSRNN